jgi:hypothetical protein
LSTLLQRLGNNAENLSQALALPEVCLQSQVETNYPA